MIKIIKWLSHKMGYKIAMIKIGTEKSPGLTIDGDKELLRYVDIVGYSSKEKLTIAISRNNAFFMIHCFQKLCAKFTL